MASPMGGPAECRLVVGPRKCGKSEAMERELARYPHLLYVGTLWNEEAYAETIAEHRERRGGRWGLVEVTGRVEDDARALASGVAAIGRPAAVLVDGLTTWAAQIAGTRGRMTEGARVLAEVLVFCALRFPDVAWCWIDASDDLGAAPGAAPEAIWRRLREGIPGLVLQTWTREGRGNGQL